MRIAERRLAELLSQIDSRRDSAERGSGANFKVSLIRDAADRFLRSHGAVDADGRYTKYDVEYSSYRKYRTKLNLFFRFAAERASPILRTSISMFLKTIAVAATSAK